MSAEQDASLISVKLVLGPFEITCTNLTKQQLNSALKDFLAIAESNSEDVSRVLEKLSGIQSRPSNNLKVHSNSMSALSITELVKKAQRKKGTDVALVIAYYLFKERGLGIINTKDLGDAYDEARLAKLTNPTNTLNMLVQTGRMKAAGDKDGLKGFTITQTGEQEVEAWLSPTA